MVRCFVAIECNNPEVIKRIKKVQTTLEGTGANLKNVEPENIHLTLKFLGEITQQKLDEVTQVVEDISFYPFTFSVEEVGVFPNMRRPTTIWAGITEGVSNIVTVFEKLDVKLSRLGFKQEHRKFQPHLTIGRVRTGQNKNQLVEELLRLKDEVFGEVKVDRIMLKKSILTPKGPIYSILAESRHS